MYYLGKERCHAGLGPVAADDGHDVAEDVRLGDGAVDVGDDDLVGGLPPVYVAVAPRGALVRRRHAELSLVHSGLQVELFLTRTEWIMVKPYLINKVGSGGFETTAHTTHS